jgi:hypothetical protein
MMNFTVLINSILWNNLNKTKVGETLRVSNNSVALDNFKRPKMDAGQGPALPLRIQIGWRNRRRLNGLFRRKNTQHSIRKL